MEASEMLQFQIAPSSAWSIRVRGPDTNWTHSSQLNEWHQQTHQGKEASEGTIYLIKWSYHQVTGAVANVLPFAKCYIQSHHMM